MHQNLSKQSNNTATIQKIIDFINDFLTNISVVFVTAWTRNAKVENIHHRHAEPLTFSHLFCDTLLSFKTAYILLAISRLRFMYCAKSLEFIGDCCDAAIFRILRSVTSL